MAITEYKFSEKNELADQLTAHVTAKLADAISTKGKASLVVSGGSTPKLLFTRLCNADLDWSKVTITLADERWVAPTDDASNEKLVRENLLIGKAAAATFVPFKNAAESAEAGVDGLQSELNDNFQGPFTLLLLGMGDDGHTASLFPCSAELDAGLNAPKSQRCIAVNPTTAPHGRMSLTLAALLESDEIGLLITGESKWNVYQAAIQGNDVKEFPVRAVLKQESVPVSVFWSE